MSQKGQLVRVVVWDALDEQFPDQVEQWRDVANGKQVKVYNVVINVYDTGTILIQGEDNEARKKIEEIKTRVLKMGLDELQTSFRKHKRFLEKEEKIRQLTIKVDALEKENVSLRTKVENLDRAFELIAKDNVTLREENAQLRREMATLTSQMQQLIEAMQAANLI